MRLVVAGFEDGIAELGPDVELLTRRGEIGAGDQRRGLITCTSMALRSRPPFRKRQVASLGLLLFSYMSSAVCCLMTTDCLMLGVTGLPRRP